ncbi:MAG: arsenate reductase ArsC [Spirochaetales bacterium]|nr:arsenate reductase ArsC [Spirochaetales bacterium]
MQEPRAGAGQRGGGRPGEGRTPSGGEMKRSVLFLCTHNSARSQMAEGLLEALVGDRYEAASAGISATRVRPQAVAVLAELGIDISGHRSKSIEEFRGRLFDVVVTVCDHARETCPFFPGKLVLHEGFLDPAAAQGSEEEVLETFRKVRDQIAAWIVATFGSAGGPEAARSGAAGGPARP